MCVFPVLNVNYWQIRNHSAVSLARKITKQIRKFKISILKFLEARFCRKKFCLGKNNKNKIFKYLFYHSTAHWCRLGNAWISNPFRVKLLVSFNIHRKHLSSVLKAFYFIVIITRRPFARIYIFAKRRGTVFSLNSKEKFWGDFQKYLFF